MPSHVTAPQAPDRSIHGDTGPAAVPAVASVRLGKRLLYVLPRAGMLYGLASLVVVLAIVVALDRFALAPLVSDGEIDGPAWRDHNNLMRTSYTYASTTDETFVRQWDGHAVSREKTTTHRILVMGDSFVWGSPYTTVNHMWWQQLAIELERRGYRDVEVIAAGFKRWSTRMQLDLLRDIYPIYQPDLVIWGYVTNDPKEGLVAQVEDSDIERLSPMLPHALAPNVAYQLETLGRAKRQEQVSGTEYGYVYDEWELELLEGANWARYRETVSELGRFMQSRDIPGFMITLPNFPGPSYFEPRYAPVLPLWEKSGVEVVNLLDAAVARFGASEGGISWGINPNNGHPGPRMTRFYAVEAADYLERHHPEALGSQTIAPHEIDINHWLPWDLEIRGDDGSGWTITYPSSEAWMPTMPLDVRAVQLALEFPLAVESVTVSAPGLESAEAWATFLVPGELYDDGEFHSLGRRQGPDLVFTVPADLRDRPMSILRFRAAGVDGPAITVSFQQSGTE